MRYSILSVLALFSGAANAHFHLNYPEPRGPFVGANEPNFCGRTWALKLWKPLPDLYPIGGYTEVTSNRSTFPLSGGFFQIKQGHPNWSGRL